MNQGRESTINTVINIEVDRDFHEPPDKEEQIFDHDEGISEERLSP